MPSSSQKTLDAFVDAAGKGQVARVATLLSQVSDVNGVDSMGWRALHSAAVNGHLPVVQLLLEADDVDCNLRDDEDGGEGSGTALHAAMENDHAAVVEFLVLQRPDILVNAQNSEGDTPLHWACAKGDAGLVRLLLRRRDINVHMKNSQGQTPAEAIPEGDEYDGIRELLSQHSDIGRLLGEEGETARQPTTSHDATQRSGLPMTREEWNVWQEEHAALQSNVHTLQRQNQTLQLENKNLEARLELLERKVQLIVRRQNQQDA